MECEGCWRCELKPRVHNFSEASKHSKNCGTGIWTLELKKLRVHPRVPLLPKNNGEILEIINAINTRKANLANSATKEPEPKKRKLTDSGDKRQDQAGGSAKKPKPKRKKWVEKF